MSLSDVMSTPIYQLSRCMCHRPAGDFSRFGLEGAGMYEDLKEYLNWYDTRRDLQLPKNAPVIGLVLQRSHLVTGDDGHYVGVVSKLESLGARVRMLSSSSSRFPCLFLSFGPPTLPHPQLDSFDLMPLYSSSCRRCWNLCRIGSRHSPSLQTKWGLEISWFEVGSAASYLGIFLYFL